MPGCRDTGMDKDAAMEAYITELDEQKAKYA